MTARPVLRVETKLTLVFLLLVLSMVAVFSIFALQGYEAEEQRAFELRARSLASLLGQSLTDPLYDLRFDQMRLLLGTVLEQPYVRYALAYDKTGKVLADGTKTNPRFNEIPHDPFHLEAMTATNVLLHYDDAAPAGVLDIAQPIFLPGGERLGGVRIGFSLQPLRQEIARARRYTVVFGLIVAIAGAVVSKVLGARLVQPVVHLLRGTQRIAAGQLDVEIPPASNDELGMLAQSFNQMMASLKQQQAALERKAVENRTLYEIGREITAQIALDPILGLIADRARGLMRADLSLLALREEEGDVFAARASSGAVTEALARLRFRSGEGLGGRVVATQAPIIVGDYLREFADSPFLDVVQRAGVRSQVAVPLKVHGAVMGVLYVGSRIPHELSEEDLQLLSALADQAAIAIENVRLYEYIRQYAEELEAKVEARTRELREANRQLAAASQHKSAFLANVSHELRTPLNAIIGFTRLVLRKSGEVLPTVQRENLQKVLLSSEHLLSLINGLLDLAKIEAGRMEVLPEDFRLHDLVAATASTVEPMLRPDVLLVREIAPDLPMLHTDREKLRQIILNLMSNAAKFTEQGEVRISASTDDGQLRLVVSDTGIGIDTSALPHIFDAFRQADMSSTRKYGGTGLGLTIVKTFAHLLGGEVRVVSEPGKGSTFTVTLPVRMDREQTR